MTNIRAHIAAACLALLLTLTTFGGAIIAPAEQHLHTHGVIAAAVLA